MNATILLGYTEAISWRLHGFAAGDTQWTSHANCVASALREWMTERRIRRHRLGCLPEQGEHRQPVLEVPLARCYDTAWPGNSYHLA